MVYKATIDEIEDIVDMAVLLFGSQDREGLRQEFLSLLNADKEGAVYVAAAGGNRIGFAQVQMRHDYVEGTESSPVGYLEGIYVKEGYRQCGHGLDLLRSCEQWARDRGCTEFASDCEIANDTSLAFHLKAGFSEANRIICFTKEIGAFAENR